MLRRCIVFIVFLSHLCNGYKLLVVFPVATKSHVMLGDAIVRHLVNAGHEVTYITPIPPNIQSPKLRIIDVSTNFNVLPPAQYMNVQTLNKESVFIRKGVARVRKIILLVANSTIFHDGVQRLIQDPNEHFDAVLIEWMFNELYSGFASVFNCPYIWVPTMEPINAFLSLIGGISHPAYTVTHMKQDEPPFTLWQRVEELYYIIDYYSILWFLSGIENKIYNKGFGTAVAKRGRVLPPYDEVKYNASLALANTYISSSLRQLDLPQTYKYIGGYHIDEDKPLPENLQYIMDNAEHGVIYFSLGSVVQSYDQHDHMKRILEVFSGLKQTVIWKFEGSFQKLPKNVHIFKWIPQQSILAHNNCRLFITHGGQLSVIEATHYGVPLIGTPVFADQFFNINRAVSKGYARRVDFGFDMPDRLNEAIHDVLQNPRYTEKAKEYSVAYHHRLASPGQELVYWVEHVIKTRGALYLRSASLYIPFYQKMYLDLAAVILIVIFALRSIVVRLCFSKKKVVLKNKIN